MKLTTSIIYYYSRYHINETNVKRYYAKNLDVWIHILIKRFQPPHQIHSSNGLK